MKKRRVNVEDTHIDLTSMIDVCFLLIAFFIMVTEVSKSEVVEVFLPFANNAIPDEDPPEDRVIVNIDRKGEIWIRTKNYGQPNEKRNRDDITNALRADAAKAGFSPGDNGMEQSNLTVYIRSDAHAIFKYVQCLMMILVHKDVKVVKVHYVAKNPTLEDA